MNEFVTAGWTPSIHAQCRLAVLHHDRIFRFTCLILLFVAFALIPTSTRAQAASLVRLASLNALGDLPTLFAEKHQLFERQGITVEILRNRTGMDNLDALMAQRVDFALMPLTPLVQYHLTTQQSSRDRDPVILSSVTHTSRLGHVVTLAGGEIHQPSDLAGYRIGLRREATAEYLWWFFAGLHRIDTSRVTVMDLTGKDPLNALIEGSVDAIVVMDTWPYSLGNLEGSSFRILGGEHVHVENWVLVTTREIATNHPDTARAMIEAYLMAIDFIESAPREAKEVYADTLELAGDKIVMEEHLPHFGMSLDWTLLADLHEIAQWVSINHGIPLDHSINILTWIESGSLKKAAPHRVRIPRTNERKETP